MKNLLNELLENYSNKLVLGIINNESNQFLQPECQDIILINDNSWNELFNLENKYDVIYVFCAFSNVSHGILKKIFEKCLTLLSLEGHLCFAEKCFDNEKLNNSPLVYNQLLETTAIHCEKSIYLYETKNSKFLNVEEECSNNDGTGILIGWVAQKIKSSIISSDNHGFKTFQQFLNNKQYSITGILRYERIFGDNFISAGGLDTTKEFVALLQLEKGQKILDVGCGIGGGPFFMAEKYGVQVHGIDLSSNVISIAMERTFKRNNNNVSFELCDATKRIDCPNIYDVIYSRDTILHIANKEQLFQSFYKWLKPGGQLLISDYCCPEGEWSKDFTAYVQQRGYYLLTLINYGQLIEKAGFKSVKVKDVTPRFVEMLNIEYKRILAIKDSFIKEFSEKDYLDLVSGWNDKLKRCALNDQVWGLFQARK